MKVKIDRAHLQAEKLQLLSRVNTDLSVFAMKPSPSNNATVAVTWSLTTSEDSLVINISLM